MEDWIYYRQDENKIINQIKESGLLVEQQQKILGNNAMQLLAKLNSVDETQIYEFQ